MTVSETKYDDEIDLLSLIETIWNGKWKIVFIVAVSLLSALGFNIVKSNTTFSASTKIKPITSFEFDKYILFNASLRRVESKEKIYEITPKLLLSSYIEEIQEGLILEKGIDKYNLINKDNFDSESEYKDALERFASKIKVLRPLKEMSHHILSAEYNDEDKWKDLLTFVNEEANKKVKASIINRFKSISSVYQQKKDFAVKDIIIKIDNIKKDYEILIKERLAFLGEQASIARKLDIQKNTIASQRFNTQNSFVTSVNADAPFYLRGYVAIEEEIKQITTRKDKDVFNKNLFKLERQKRNLEQDKTIERAVELFNKTPLNQNAFQATIVKVATTDYKKINKKTNFYYFLALVLGGMIGVVYVLIANAFRNRKNEIVSF